MSGGPGAVRLLTFSTLFPNPGQPNHGVFVENRLRHLIGTGLASSTVLAPVPWFPAGLERLAPARMAAWTRYALASPGRGNPGRPPDLASTLSRAAEDRHVRGTAAVYTARRGAHCGVWCGTASRST